MKVDGAGASNVVVDLTIDAEINDADLTAERQQGEQQVSRKEDGSECFKEVVHKVFGSVLASGKPQSGGLAVPQFPDAYVDSQKVEEKKQKIFSGSGSLLQDFDTRNDEQRSGPTSHHRQARHAEGAHETSHEKQEANETITEFTAKDELLTKGFTITPEKVSATSCLGQSTQTRSIQLFEDQQGGNSKESTTVLQFDGVRDADACNRTYRKGVWLLPELMALQAAKREQYESLVKAGYRVRNSKPEKERWQEIENFCWRDGVHRSGDQCHARWEYIAREFRKIIDYENISPQGQSYWQMNHVERKEKDLPMNFHHDLFQVMVDWMGAGKAPINTGAASPNAIQALASSAPLPEWLSSGRIPHSDAITSPSTNSLDCTNTLKSGDALSNIAAHFPFHGKSFESSQTSSKSVVDAEPQAELPSGLSRSGKKMRTGLKGGDGAGSAVEPNNRYMAPREATLRADEGSLLLCNCNVVHLGPSPTVSKGEHILIRNKHIVYVGPSPVFAAQMVDLAGRYVMPGLCDAHVHVTAVTANLHDLGLIPSSLITARATKVLKDMLMRGFTTVRDAGVCDWGLAKAVEEGTLLGPRILFSGHALSQTGGHGDMRLPNEDSICSCSSALTLGRVCDGVAEVRRAARDELRKGAHQIKIMASGGVSSPTDHLSSLQFSSEEIAAIVEEASHVGRYVCAHAYTSAAVKRVLELGVRSIEHGNLVDEDCIDLIKRKGAYLVPTLVTYDQIRQHGEAAGMATDLVAKVGNLLEKGLEVLSLAEQKGANICFGTDLLGDMHDYQLQEFALRSKVQSPAAVLRSATSTCAQLFRMEGKVGTLAEGAYADILVLEKNPLLDISVLEDTSNIVMILKEGEIVKLSKGMTTKVVEGHALIQLS